LLIDPLLNSVASIINLGIDANPKAQDLCDALDGRSLRLVIKPLTGPILIASVDGALEASTDLERHADTEITGTLIELNRLMFIDSQAPLREGHVEIIGDVEIADRFRELLLCARPDLEEKLADWLGAPMATQISSFVRETREWVTDIAEDLTDHVADYLHDKAGRLPTHQEVGKQFAAVDEFVNAVERLEARINRLDPPTEVQPT
jgi:ubiquinone biosynthesis protein UbiJ